MDKIIRNILLFLIALVSTIIVAVLAFVCVAYYLGYLQFGSQDVVAIEEEMPPEKAKKIFNDLAKLKKNDATAEVRLAFLIEEKSKLNEGDISLNDQAYMDLLISDLSFKSDVEGSIGILADLYTNEKYNELSEWLPAQSLMRAMLFATEIGSPRLTFSQAKNLIFTPERFGPVVGINTSADMLSIRTNEDIKRLASIGLDKAADISPYDIKKIRARIESSVLKSSVLLSRLYEIDTSVDFIAPVAQERLASTSDMQLEVINLRNDVDDIYRLTKIEIENTEVYSADILYSLNFSQKLYIDLFFLGQDTFTKLEEVRTELKKYVERYNDESIFSTNRSRLINATSDMFYSCSLIIKNKYVTDDILSQKIKSNLATLIDSPKENAQEHGAPLAEISKNPHYACYEPFIQIGNEIEPGFKDFLIEDIGSWTNEQFE